MKKQPPDAKIEEKLAENKENKAKIPEDKLAEVGGRGGLDPSRFGDWEIAGKCVDF